MIQAQSNLLSGGLQMTDLIDEPLHRVAQANIVQVSRDEFSFGSGTEPAPLRGWFSARLNSSGPNGSPC